jgi:hypothetical protein
MKAELLNNRAFLYRSEEEHTHEGKAKIKNIEWDIFANIMEKQEGGRFYKLMFAIDGVVEGNGSLQAPKDRKVAKADAPVLLGWAKVRGLTYWLAAWVSTNAEGTNYLDIKMSEQEEKASNTTTDNEIPV